MLEFRELNEFERGILYKLLYESYSEILKFRSSFAEEYKSSWNAEDDNAFDNPDSIGKCILVSVLNNEPIGFISWDPRRIPAEGIIGQNCIVPFHRGKGFGKLQIKKVMEIFRSELTGIIKVSTGNHPFFIPAQKAYLSCGFKIGSYGFTKAYGGMELINFEYKGEIK